MTLSVEVINKQRKIKVSSKKVISRIKKILSFLYKTRDKNLLKITVKNPILSISVIFIGDKKMKELNFKYRGKKSTTDILSFPYLENEPSGNMFLGEIIINPIKVLSQAKKYNETFWQELDRILAHGVLHLIGYDHENVSIGKAKKMRKLEEKILSNLKP
ncbi:MAG: rRNA maturation RNase YbeY [Thermodesulfovibrio sp.]|nr:rRNA maturation RNase YbeY [Thermodesulfovibrio sp.]MDW7998969.1 rRNA maturation RNase YbeY [Thermodesulfovibrio sp.]